MFWCTPQWSCDERHGIPVLLVTPYMSQCFVSTPVSCVLFNTGMREGRGGKNWVYNYIPADWVLELVGVATGCGVTGEGAEEWRIRLGDRLSRINLYTPHTTHHYIIDRGGVVNSQFSRGASSVKVGVIVASL